MKCTEMRTSNVERFLYVRSKQSYLHNIMAIGMINLSRVNVLIVKLKIALQIS